jgi:NinB protein
MTQYFLDSELWRNNAMTAVKVAPQGYVVEIREPKRLDVQNRKMWALLKDISDQVVWHGRKLNSEDWKAMLTAGLTKSEPIEGIEQGTMILLGVSTRTMSRKFFSELFEYMYAFGTDQNVVWSEKSVNEIEAFLFKF